MSGLCFRLLREGVKGQCSHGSYMLVIASRLNKAAALINLLFLKMLFWFFLQSKLHCLLANLYYIEINRRIVSVFV